MRTSSERRFTHRQIESPSAFNGLSHDASPPLHHILLFCGRALMVGAELTSPCSPPWPRIEGLHCTFLTKQAEMFVLRVAASHPSLLLLACCPALRSSPVRRSTCSCLRLRMTTHGDEPVKADTRSQQAGNPPTPQPQLLTTPKALAGQTASRATA